ncbi:hypothetical protein R1flu_014914 [Riccia fluitans]|uniref:U-box domain-containing protein 12 n=1 Tax=Riccia fluitans TaxID=41844 RepID=A0ABD1YHE8_9MARC
MAEGPPSTLMHSLADVVNDIIQIGDYRRTHKKECVNLTRRVKLLAPLFEEVKDLKGPLPEDAIACFTALEKALYFAKKLLRLCHNGSKLYLVMEMKAVSQKFQDVTAELAGALDALPWDHLEVSDEVREQVELVHTQLKRAKGRVDVQDQLLQDIQAILDFDRTEDPDETVLERIAEHLDLRTMAEVKAELKALQSLDKGGDVDENLQKMFRIVKYLMPNDETDNSSRSSGLPTSDAAGHDSFGSDKSSTTAAEKLSSIDIPEDFKCPISLELMRDPVILATGQTYERACIQKWLDEGRRSCPTTGVPLPHYSLTPNYVLRSLIAQWCETNGVEVPKRPSRIGKPCTHMADVSPDAAAVEILLNKLSTGNLDEQRAAAGELRMLAKRNVENRICIADAGAIPLLVKLLSTPDLKTQEHAVTALLNLSINDINKGAIVQAGAIYPIVEVLKSGSMEARENAAATLFSLSVVDENKVTIGASGAIPALVELLKDGSPRGKKDAATALFNLSIYQGNKAKAVRAGVVPPLIELLADPSAGMVDESLAILAILATHQEGRVAIGFANAIPILVDLITSGSPRNKENATAALLALSLSDRIHVVDACKRGAQGPLSELVRTGTPRARRKATQLLEYMKKLNLEQGKDHV